MAAGATYEPISTTTLGSAASTITFSSIATTYTDLKLVVVGRSDRAGTSTDGIRLRFNSDTATNYSETFMYGDGTTAGSSNGTNQTAFLQVDIPAATATTGVFALVTYDIFSYAGSTYKTMLCTDSRDMNGSGVIYRTVGLWRSTSAVNTATLSLGVGNFITGTTATLYGIKNSL